MILIGKTRAGMKKPVANTLFSSTPTQVIEKSPITRERGYYKQPGKQLVRASKAAEEKSFSVLSRNPRKGETMSVHTHNHTKGQQQVVMPSILDINMAINRLTKHPDMKTHIVAVRVQGRVVGYTFYQLSKPKTLKKRINIRQNRGFGFVNERIQTNHWQSLSRARQKEELKMLKEKFGLTFHFVSNAKRGYVFDYKVFQFVKK